MFDIICTEAEPEEYGFKKFYIYNNIKNKISRADNLASALKFHNRKSLVMLRNHDFDIGTIKRFANKRKACFLIDLSHLIRSSGIRRAILISKLMIFLHQCNRFGAFYAFVSFAERKNEIRSTDELAYIIMLLGINKGQARASLNMLPVYLE